MSDIDVSALSYSELVKLRAQLEQQILDKRAEELKVLADGFVKKLEASGFSVLEAVEALQPYLSATKQRRSTTGATAPILYRDPANPSNTWSGRGRAAKWLSEYEAQGRKREEFKV